MLYPQVAPHTFHKQVNCETSTLGYVASKLEDMNEMIDAHVYEMQLWKPNTWGVTYVGVSDLDLGSMTILSTRVSHGLTKLHTKQAAYELVFLF
jgi:hypothetical protein